MLKNNIGIHHFVRNDKIGRDFGCSLEESRHCEAPRSPSERFIRAGNLNYTETASFLAVTNGSPPKWIWG